MLRATWATSTQFANKPCGESAMGRRIGPTSRPGPPDGAPKRDSSRSCRTTHFPKEALYREAQDSGMSLPQRPARIIS
jgi:hypothetical protein